MKVVFVARNLQGLEAALVNLPGVQSANPGPLVSVSSGHSPSPQMDETPDGVRSVEVDYDPARVPFEKLLETFWQCHDPEVPLQSAGPVRDRPYSAVLYYDDDQRIRTIMAKIQIERTGRFERPLATLILPASDLTRVDERGLSGAPWQPPLLRGDPPSASAGDPSSAENHPNP